MTSYHIPTHQFITHKESFGVGPYRMRPSHSHTTLNTHSHTDTTRHYNTQHHNINTPLSAPLKPPTRSPRYTDSLTLTFSRSRRPEKKHHTQQGTQAAGDGGGKRPGPQLEGRPLARSHRHHTRSDKKRGEQAHRLRIGGFEVRSEACFNATHTANRHKSRRSHQIKKRSVTSPLQQGGWREPYIFLRVRALANLERRRCRCC